MSSFLSNDDFSSDGLTHVFCASLPLRRSKDSFGPSASSVMWPGKVSTAALHSTIA